jgi:HEAT repeat protein
MRGAFMSDEVLSDLVEQLSSRRGTVRERARHMLVLIGSPAAPLLLELAQSSAKRPRWEAAKALASMVEPSSIPTLVGLLSDPESEIRWLAAEGLIKLGTRSLPEVLRLLMDNPDSVEVRRAVHHVLHDLSSMNPVLEEAVAPVMQALGDTEPTSAIPLRTEHALKRIESLQRGGISEW